MTKAAVAKPYRQVCRNETRKSGRTKQDMLAGQSQDGGQCRWTVGGRGVEKNR